MARQLVPGPGVVVRHQVPEGEVAIHIAEVEAGVVLGPRGAGDRKKYPVIEAGAGVRARRWESRVERGAGFAEQVDEIARLGFVGRVLPVDVKAVETEVLD